MKHLSIKEIKENYSVKRDRRTAGGFKITPPLQLRCRIDTDDWVPIPPLGVVKKGEIVHATKMIDETGKHPNTICLEEKWGWWPVENFELVK